MSSGLWQWLLLLGLLFPAGQAALAAAAPAATDVRIVIDISGSMKKTDPQNLRAPALRLLAGVLPADTQAGVWTFGQYVNMLVKHGPVTQEWRNQAVTASDQIASVALYTNLEYALERATRKWDQADPDSRRSLILLTDGKVDISKDKQRNRASRQRIIERFIPRIRDAGVAVHTIALSADADQVLLEQLSQETDGWYEQVASAEQLQRVFLRMFEKAAPRDTLPLTDNGFTVDGSIEELTLLVFRPAGSDPTAIRMPDGTRISADQLAAEARWVHEDQFDLITIPKPAAGQWQILAAADPDNRAMVVTSLTLEVAGLPNHISAGESFSFEVRLLQDGKFVDNKEFLSLLEVSLLQKADSGKEWSMTLLDNGEAPDAVAGDGLYTTLIDQSLQVAGQHELNLVVDGKTFQREFHQLLRVADMPVAVAVTRIEDETVNGYRVDLTADPELVNPQTVTVQATGIDSTGERQELVVERGGESGWQVDVADSQGQGAVFNVDIQVAGENQRGRSFAITVEQIVLERALPQPASVADASEEPGLAEVVVAEEIIPGGDVSWLEIGFLAAVNLLLLVGGGLWFWLWRRNSGPLDLGLEEATA